MLRQIDWAISSVLSLEVSNSKSSAEKFSAESKLRRASAIVRSPRSMVRFSRTDQLLRSEIGRISTPVRALSKLSTSLWRVKNHTIAIINQSPESGKRSRYESLAINVGPIVLYIAAVQHVGRQTVNHSIKWEIKPDRRRQLFLKRLGQRWNFVTKCKVYRRNYEGE